MKILLIGYGAMNQRVARLAEEKGHEIVGVIENTPKATTPYQQYQHIADVKDADVAIDFSNPNLLFPLLDEEFHLPLVVATTGEKEKLLNKLDELSQNMPVFFSANMSYGVHALTKILAAAVKVGLSAVVPLTMIAWALFSSKKLTCAFKASRLTLLFVKGVVSATPTPSNKCVILIRSF